MISFRDVTFGYPGQVPVFSEFSWQASVGDRWAVLGPSGCGKTTLLYLIAGLRLPEAGEVTVAGESVRQPGRATSLVLQDHGLLPWSTALDNAALGLVVRGVPRRNALARAGAVLDRLGVGGLDGRFPSQLSGGQRQRVAIARALATDPSVLLMDEPFASLDALTREDLHDLLQSIASDAAQPLTTVIVTHDIAEAVLLTNRLLVLGPRSARPGIIVDNPLGGTPGFRDSPEYAEACRVTRALVTAARQISVHPPRAEVRVG